MTSSFSFKLSVLLAVCAMNAGATEWRYDELVDGKTKQSTVLTRQGQNFSLRYPDMLFELSEDEAGATQKLNVTRISSDAKLHVNRAGENFILPKGDQKTTESTEKLAWYQSPFVLSAFVQSKAAEQEFWIMMTSGEGKDLRVSPLKLVAKRQGKESITLSGVPTEVTHVMLTLPGLKSLFWKSHYWYRADGTLVRYEEDRAKKGKAVGVLAEEKP